MPKTKAQKVLEANFRLVSRDIEFGFSQLKEKVKKLEDGMKELSDLLNSDNAPEWLKKCPHWATEPNEYELKDIENLKVQLRNNLEKYFSYPDYLTEKGMANLPPEDRLEVLTYREE